MKRIFVSVVMVALLGLMPTIASSFTIEQYPTLGSWSNPNSGYYLGTILNENDSLAIVEGVLDQISTNYAMYGSWGVDLSTVVLTGSSKVEYPATSSDDGDFPLYVTYADDGGSGQWATGLPMNEPPPGSTLVDFYAVKGSNQFALYWQYPDGAASGTWNAGNLRTDGPFSNVPSISHFSGYTTGSTAVPEPATMLLLGFGLLGVAGVRKFKK